MLSTLRVWATTVAALCLAMPPSAAAQETAARPPALDDAAGSSAQPNDRTSATHPSRGKWYIGFGLGYGNGRVDLGDRSAGFGEMVSGDATHVSFDFKVGATVSPKLLVGLETGFVSATHSGLFSGTSSFQTNHYDIGVTYFPMEQGLFLRGGSGLSRTVGDATGFNVLGGVGYAFWLGRSFNLGLNLQAVKHWFGGGVGLRAATDYAVYLGFDWY